MPAKYKTESQHREARLLSKRRCYERHKLDERLKSQTHWRKHVGATAVTQQLLQQLDNIWLDLDADNLGWPSTRPSCEGMVSDAKQLLCKAREVLSHSLNPYGACSDYLCSGAAAAVDAVELDCDTWEEALSLMDDSVETYFDLLKYNGLAWQKALKPCS
ncbi:hypothetical protein F4604DRAFT_1922863 [Suillus subluteus]|nr:hypothetical protein F4604DRAFT_1922863 [Suillus subluteus]